MKNARHTIFLAALVSLALPLSHYTYAAAPPPGEDLFGMYADNNFNDDPSDENPTFVIGEGLIQVYIYLTNVIYQSIGAFEFALAYSGPGESPVMTDLGLPPGGTNFGTPPDYIVGLAAPLFTDEYGHAILMSPTYVVLDSDPVYVSVTPTSVPWLPEQISYVPGGTLPILCVMHPASGNFVDPIFAFNSGLVATESATWSGVKALYR